MGADADGEGELKYTPRRSKSGVRKTLHISHPPLPAQSILASFQHVTAAAAATLFRESVLCPKTTLLTRFSNFKFHLRKFCSLALLRMSL